MLITDGVLLSAIKEKDVIRTKEALSDGVDANALSDDGHPALLLAIVSGKIEIVRLLLEHGADPNTTYRGSTALFIGVQQGDSDIVCSLLDKGADVNISDNNGVNALHKAAMHNHIGITKLLLEHGAFVDARQYDGTTALMLAAMKGNSDIVKILLNAGADRELTCGHRFRAIDFALNHNFTDIINMLNEKGEVPPSNGVTWDYINKKAFR